MVLSPAVRHRRPPRPGARRTVLLALAGCAMLALAAAAGAPGRAAAADATPSPPAPGHHVVDDGHVLSAHAAQTAEALAAHLEASGAGRVVVYTVPEDQPASIWNVDSLSSAWGIDGLLIASAGSSGRLQVGPALEARLDANQAKVIDGSSPGMQTVESWITSTLARADAFVSHTHVFDGAGVLDAAAKAKAETAATDLASKVGGPVYVDIALGGTDPQTAAFFNGADVRSTLDSALLVALGVSDTRIGGYVASSGDAFDKYKTADPWASNGKLSSGTAAGGDIQAAVIAAIDGVKPYSVTDDVLGFVIPLFAFIIAVFIVSIFGGRWLVRRLGGVSEPITNGIPSTALIESIADTGMTISSSEFGPEAPRYKLGLQVAPVTGATLTPYHVDVKAVIPRLFVPMIMPGARIGVLVDPANPTRISLDYNRIGPSAAMPGAAMQDMGTAPANLAYSMGQPVTTGVGGTGFSFAPDGQPAAGAVDALVGAVRSGALPSIRGSAAELLATGTHGTAVITTAQPLGKTVRDVNPAADPSRLNDPMWLFTLEVTLPGQPPFPAVFGHRVPPAKLGDVVPGARLAVAVNLADRNQEVAIDWDRSPLPG